MAGMVVALGNLAGSFGDNGQLELAISTGLEALAAARAAALRPFEMLNAANLSTNLYRAGRFEEAFAMAREALDVSHWLGERVGLGWAAVILALAALRRGQPAIAARLWGWIEAAFLADHFALSDTEAAIAKALVAAIESALPESERVSLLTEGASMTVDEVVTLAAST
jgi:tetratricopeptide (TPR) repeat protein